MDTASNYATRISRTITGEVVRATQEVPLLTAKDGELITMDSVFYGEDDKGWTIRALGDKYVWGERNGEYKRLKPEWLTSKRPDSWEQLERDLLTYPHQCGLSTATGLECHQFDSCLECSRARVEALIRRAKALGGVE